MFACSFWYPKPFFHTLHRCPFCRHSPGSNENLVGSQNFYKFCKWRTYSFHMDRILLFFFFLSQSFIFVQLSSATFCGIPCTIFPCVWSNNSTKFLFTRELQLASPKRCSPLTHIFHTPSFPDGSLGCRNSSSLKISTQLPGKDLFLCLKIRKVT